MLELVQLDAYAGRKPAQLSGGPAAAGRAGARARSTSRGCCCSTSRSARSTSSCAAQMQIELKRIQTEVGITFVHVTHDQEEAMTMADTIAVMNAGRHRADGRAGRALREPADDVRRQLPRPVQPHHGRGRSRPDGDASTVDCDGQKTRLAGSRRAHERGRGWLGVRPEKVVSPAGAGGGRTGSRRPNTLGGGRDQRRQLRRGEHPVPRPDAVGPGAHGLRAEHRQRATAPRGTRSTSVAPEHAFLLDADQDADAGIPPRTCE